MTANDEAASAFWRRVGAMLGPGAVVAALPHTAALVVADASSDAERETVRRSYLAVMRATVGGADGRLKGDLERRGYRPVALEEVARAALQLGLGEADWSEPAAACEIGRAVGAEMVMAGDFRFQVSLLPRSAGAAPGARQEVCYTLVALDVARGREVARSPLVCRWESLLPSPEAQG